MKPDAPASAAGIPGIGEVFAQRYRLERSLGRGSMGAVFAAQHVSLRQRVAVKFLLPRAKDFPGASARFLREARAAAAIRSEHVARVIDVGTAELGLPYLVMEYLRGRDLQQVLDARGPLPVSEAVDYVLQSCEAVAEAHARGIVHRDLKPGNLFLTTGASGVPLVKVLDFGLSKAADDSVEETGKLTASEMMLGSPCYMSPEQVRSTKDVDARTDVWSLGIILYQLLTARFPFDAPSISALFVAIVTEPATPPRVHRWELPVHLEEVILSCLEKDVQRRIQSVVELSRALAPYGTEHSARALDQIEAIAAGKAFPSLPPPSSPATPPYDPAAITVPADRVARNGASSTWPYPDADEEHGGRQSRRATVAAPHGGDLVMTLPSPGAAVEPLHGPDAAPVARGSAPAFARSSAPAFARSSVPVSSDEGPTLTMARDEGPTLTMARERDEGPTLTMARERDEGPTLTMAREDRPTLPLAYRLAGLQRRSDVEETAGSMPVVTERGLGQQSSIMLRKHRRAAARIAAGAVLTAAVAVGATLWSRSAARSPEVVLPSGQPPQASGPASSLAPAAPSGSPAPGGAAGPEAPALPPGPAPTGPLTAGPAGEPAAPEAPHGHRPGGPARKVPQPAPVTSGRPAAAPPHSAVRPRAPAPPADSMPPLRDDR
ncbi:protein kinase domain-containing protein [Sorangium sp. So ce1151]|uniref:serine/threonine-protein kinase n=1 Tax=Sorangium sp. So ce1151 TaxID=3133332 RepID=UPI003F605843